MKAQLSDAGPSDPWSQMMRASIAGDEAVYRRLLEDIGRSVRAMARAAFARARVGDADIEDAVQETLLAIHLKRHTWDPARPLAPWVYAIARHKIVDALRRRGRQRIEPLEDFQEFLAAPEAEDPHALSDAAFSASKAASCCCVGCTSRSMRSTGRVAKLAARGSQSGTTTLVAEPAIAASCRRCGSLSSS